MKFFYFLLDAAIFSFALYSCFNLGGIGLLCAFLGLGLAGLNHRIQKLERKK